MTRILFAGVLALLAGCDPQAPSSGAPKLSFQNVDVTGANFAQDFALNDHKGERRTLADFRGKVVTVFFGFTQCPDICPSTLADMAQVKQRLGTDGDRLQVLFVTLDPERDTRAVLAQYVPGFDPSFIGLYGSPQETAKTAKDFKVFVEKVPGKTPTSYTINHTAGSYVYDRQGRLRLFLKHGQGIEPVIADIKQLL